MPLKQPRFIHVQTPDGDKRGFSVLILSTSVDADASSPAFNQMLVEFRTTMCSKEDQFSRAEARYMLNHMFDEEHTKACRVVDFPAMLAALDARCYSVKFDKLDKKQQRNLSNRFAWVWKYFL